MWPTAARHMISTVLIDAPQHKYIYKVVYNTKSPMIGRTMCIRYGKFTTTINTTTGSFMHTYKKSDYEWLKRYPDEKSEWGLLVAKEEE